MLLCWAPGEKWEAAFQPVVPHLCQGTSLHIAGQQTDGNIRFLPKVVEQSAHAGKNAAIKAAMPQAPLKARKIDLVVGLEISIHRRPPEILEQAGNKT